jgi:hypothetical protein
MKNISAKLSNTTKRIKYAFEEEQGNKTKCCPKLKDFCGHLEFLGVFFSGIFRSFGIKIYDEFQEILGILEIKLPMNFQEF